MSNITKLPDIAQSPDHKLATIITSELAAQGLVRREKQDLLVTKLATGQMTEVDWRIEISALLEAAKVKKGVQS
jgi:hypothetical protein